MNLYQFTLPVYTNNRDSYEKAHKAFTDYLLREAGGYTDCGQVTGFWQGGVASTTYKDHNKVYQVACAPEIAARFTDKAFELFPDQEAIYTAQIGAAEVTFRQAKAA